MASKHKKKARWGRANPDLDRLRRGRPGFGGTSRGRAKGGWSPGDAGGLAGAAWGDRRSTTEEVDDLLVAAAHACHRLPGSPDAEGLVAVLSALPGSYVSHRLVAAFDRVIDTAWRNGWQPADLPRAARRLPATVQAAVVDAVAHQALTYTGPGVYVHPDWADQLAAIGAEVWWQADQPLVAQWAARHRQSATEALTGGLTALGFLLRLPRLPLLMPPPGRWDPTARPARREGAAGVEAKILERVRALLAKAESTTFPAEAEAFTAKAQELMSRYAIDTAMLEQDGADGAGPEGRRIGVDDPYATAKSLLLSKVAEANRCQTVAAYDLGFTTVFGFAADMAAVELLYTSLLVQADVAMAAAGPVRDHLGRSRTRSFRSSFLTSFAIRIGERLRETSSAAVDDAMAAHGASLLPVLADRSRAVDNAVSEAFPDLVSRVVKVSNAAGWAAGRTAADLANLSPHRPLDA